MCAQLDRTLTPNADGRYHVELAFPPLGRRFAALDLSWTRLSGYSYNQSAIFHVLLCSGYRVGSLWDIPEEVSIAVIKAWYQFERAYFNLPPHQIAESIPDTQVIIETTLYDAPFLHPPRH